MSFMTQPHMNINLSRKLKEFLTKEEITLEEASNMCDIPYETLRNIYYGKTTNPELNTLVKLIKGLNMSPYFLTDSHIGNSDEEELLKYFREAGKNGRSVIKKIAKNQSLAYKKNGKNDLSITLMIPQSRDEDGILNSAIVQDRILTNNPKAFIAYKLGNNNFSNRGFSKGDVILLEDRHPKNEEMAVFSDGTYSYFRIFLETDDGYILKSMNRKGVDFKGKRLSEWNCVGTYIGLIEKE